MQKAIEAAINTPAPTGAPADFNVFLIVGIVSIVFLYIVSYRLFVESFGVFQLSRLTSALIWCADLGVTILYFMNFVLSDFSIRLVLIQVSILISVPFACLLFRKLREILDVDPLRINEK